MKISINVKSNFNENEFMSMYNKIVKATTKLVRIGEASAKKTFLLKRKSKNSINASPLFSSFAIEIGTPSNKQVLGYFYSGGPEAYYAEWVENDHRLVNGKMWSEVNPNAPYEFMAEGLEELEKNIEKELDKALGV